jgi:hypothetical protein
MEMARRELYRLSDEHRAQLTPWAQRWIANALSTAPMTEADREACREAVEGLYRAAGKRPPPRERIVFVPSPFVVRFAGGFASAIWYLRKQPDATYDATDAATAAATRAATDVATYAATYDVTRAATDAATRAATLAATVDVTYAATRDATADATDAATDAATRAATRAATEAATDVATRAATDAATAAATRAATDAATDDLSRWYVLPGDMHTLSAELGVGLFGLRCANAAWRLWQGGNQWSAWDSYLTFFQDIARLDLPEYTNYQHWRTLSERSGPRVVHDEFCIISDRPEILLVDDLNRPHCETGPFCRWRDGTALYAVHGVRVPAWLIEQPKRLTIAAIDAERNEEIRRVMIERYGWERYGQDSGAEVIDHDERWGTLKRRGGDLWLEVVNRSPEPDGTFRRYALPVHPELRPILSDDGVLGAPQKLTALAAVASTFGMTAAAYKRALPSLGVES